MTSAAGPRDTYLEASLGVFVYDKNATSNGGPKNALNTHWSLFSILEDVLFNTQV